VRFKGAASNRFVGLRGRWQRAASRPVGVVHGPRSALLRASHIVPWADCSDEQRLDVHNGLLLSALWDAAFDEGLVSFADDGRLLASPHLGEIARKTLGVNTAPPLRGLKDKHQANLALHRARHGFTNESDVINSGGTRPAR
jgi:HNH endonuclease